MGWNCKYAGVGVWGVLVRFERYCKNSLCLNIGLTELPLTHVSMSDSTAVTNNFCWRTALTAVI